MSDSKKDNQEKKGSPQQPETKDTAQAAKPDPQKKVKDKLEMERLKLQVQHSKLTLELENLKRQDRDKYGAIELELRIKLMEEQTRELHLRANRLAHEEEQLKASSKSNFIYMFTTGVNETSVQKCLEQLDHWSRLNPGKDITIILNSPGGLVTHGLALYDYLIMLRENGHFITVMVLGQAASMGGILLQAGNRRLMGPSSRLLIHDVSAGTIGKRQKMHEDMELFDMMWDQLAEILAERSKLTKRQVQNKAKHRDWWLTAKEAVELGFADEIISKSDKA